MCSGDNTQRMRSTTIEQGNQVQGTSFFHRLFAQINGIRPKPVWPRIQRSCSQMYSRLPMHFGPGRRGALIQ